MPWVRMVAVMARISGRLLVVVLFVLNRAAGRREERVLERRGGVAPSQGGRLLEREQPPAVEDPDAVGERLGLGHVVRAQQRGRVVRAADLADELLHVALGARVEA